MIEQNVIEQNEISTSDIANVANRSIDLMASGPPTVPATQTGSGNSASAPLFAEAEAQRFRGKWTDIQSEFVDEPRNSVEKADHLVAETIKRLAEIFTDERSKLEREWSKGEDHVSTEDLRLALRRYHSFFDRLLSA